MKYCKASDIVVLYAEDDPLIRDIVSDSLIGYVDNFYVSDDGKKAYELFLEHKPDILITDLLMPELNGLSLIEKVKKNHPETKVVVLSAFDDSEKLLECIELGVDKFFKKPLELSLLQNYILGLCENVERDKKLKESIKVLNEYKKAIDESSIVSKTDKFGIINYANERFCKISGYTQDELIGSSHNIVRHPDNPTALYEDLWRTILDKQIWRGMIKNRKKDGGDYIVDAVIVPILDEDGHIDEFLAIRYDVTEYIKHEEELRRLKFTEFSKIVDEVKIKNKKFIFEKLPLPVFEINSEDIVIDSNEHFLDLFDRLENEALYERAIGGVLDIKEVLLKNSTSLYEDLIDWKTIVINGIDEEEFLFKCGSDSKAVDIKISFLEEEGSYLGVICLR